MKGVHMGTTQDNHKGFLRESMDDVKAVFSVLTSPARLKAKMADFSQRRKDNKVAARLNGQIRKQFIAAYDASDKDEYSVKLNRMLDDYKARNGAKSWLLKPYEIFSHWNIPSKIIAGLGFFKGASYILTPVMGAWALTVPLGTMIASRMALTHKDASNLRQEQQMAEKGIVAPIRVSVKNGALLYNGVNVHDNFKVAFPVRFQATPEWITAEYLKEKQHFAKHKTEHAFTHELSLRPDGAEKLAAIMARFRNDKDAQNAAALLHIVMPDSEGDAINARVAANADKMINVPAEKKGGYLAQVFSKTSGAGDAYTEISMNAALVKAFEPFAKRMPQDLGMKPLSGALTQDDTEYLAHMLSRNLCVGDKQASLIQTMYKKNATYQMLSFTQRVEVALFPENIQTMFMELWSERHLRDKFDFSSMREIILNFDDWGAVALKINAHDYAQDLTAAQIIELSQSDNAHWAKIYHDLKTDDAISTAHLTHSALKSLTQRFGQASKEQLTRQENICDTAHQAGAQPLKAAL